MKDAYSFDVDEAGMEAAYENMWKAYERVFDRLELNYRVVQGDTGAMGGSVSHEFMAMSNIGESLIAYCSDCNYAATDEKAAVVYNVEVDKAEELEKEKVYTPNVTTIEALTEFLGVEPSRFLKSLVFVIDNKPVIALIPGDRELNETKLCNYLGIGSHDIEMADESVIIDITGANKGFTGPVELKKQVRLIVDKRVTEMKNLVVGGNETDYHIKNVNYGRDFKGEIVEDLLLIKEDDICPDCGSKLKMDRGIEVGNIFQLGTKYSDALSANFLDENGKEKPFVMGCYGIGVSRSMAAVVEQFHDEDGIRWPLSVAPYEAIVTVVNIKDEVQMELGEKIYSELKNSGIETLIDDRKERAGVKFKDRDLIGIPVRITVGKRASEDIVEYSIRGENDKIEVGTKELNSLLREYLKR